MFTRAIKLLDGAQLARLENFTASLQPEASSSDSITHPARLYELLCQAARTYIDSRIQAPPEDLTLAQNLPDSFGGFGLVNFGDEENGGTAGDGSYTYGLSDWYYGNQQLMQLLDEDMTF